MAGRCGRRPPWRRLVPLLVGAALAATLAAGCGESENETPTTTSEAAAVKVERVPRDRWSWARARFNEMCAGCHTLADARATGRRFNLDANAELNDQLVRETILGGGPGMPPFASSISYREYEQLTSYILAVAGRAENLESGWQYQIRLRREGEHERPQGWPASRWLKATRYNP
jgi:mono/diheme cytochrome c family protein